MPEDTLDRLLKNEKIMDHLKSRKQNLHDMFMNLYQAYQQYHPNESVDGVVMDNLVWEIVKLDPIVSSFFLEHNEYMEELKNKLDDGIASKRIVKKIRGILKQEYPDEFSSLTY